MNTVRPAANNFLRERQLIFLIVLAGFFLRLAGVQFGLPYLYHADEPIVVNHALAYGSGDLNPHFFKIPPLVSYCLAGFYGFAFLLGRLAGVIQGAGDFEALFYRDPSFFYLYGRILLGVIPGTLSIYLLYRVLKRHFSSPVALLAAALFSASFLHVRDSHYIYADIPLVLSQIFLFGQIFRVIDDPKDTRAHLLAGALIGLACAVKYNGIFFAVPYGVAVFFCSRKVRVEMIAGAIISAALTFILLNPYAVFDPSTFLAEVTQQSKSQSGTPPLHHFSYSLWEGIGPFMLCFAVGGIIEAIQGKNIKRMSVAVFAVLYYGVLVKAGQPYDRYVLPLIVPAVFMAADFIFTIAGRKKFNVKLFVLLVVLAIAPNLVKGVLFDKVMMSADVRTEAKAWVEENIPGGSAVALGWEFYTPRLFFTKAQLEEKMSALSAGGEFSGARLRRLSYYLNHPAGKAFHLFFLREDSGGSDENRTLLGTPSVPYDFGVLRKLGVNYLIIPVTSPAMNPADFYQKLSEEADLIKRFNPYKSDNQRVPLDSQPLTGGPFLWGDLRARNSNGVPIEIYKLKPR